LGSLTLEFEAADIKTWVAEELQTVAQEVREGGGTVGHIKAAVSESFVNMISVEGEKALVEEPSGKRARITLDMIVYKVEPKEAEEMARKALAKVRTRLREHTV
jgi:hypothetical protein